MLKNLWVYRPAARVAGFGTLASFIALTFAWVILRLLAFDGTPTLSDLDNALSSSPDERECRKTLKSIENYFMVQTADKNPTITKSMALSTIANAYWMMHLSRFGQPSDRLMAYSLIDDSLRSASKRKDLINATYFKATFLKQDGKKEQARKIMISLKYKVTKKSEYQTLLEEFK